MCYCSTGFTGVVGGPCRACSNCISVVSFMVTMAMTTTDFNLVVRDVYVTGVAQTLSTETSSVTIGSVTEKISHRRLLTTSIEVETIVMVSKDRASSVVEAATFENFSRAFMSSGISIGVVSEKIVVDYIDMVAETPHPQSRAPKDYSLVIAIVCAITAVLIFIGVGFVKSRWYRTPNSQGTVCNNQTLFESNMSTDADHTLQISAFMDNMHRNTSGIGNSHEAHHNRFGHAL
jgi:hypothetical protein